MTEAELTALTQQTTGLAYIFVGAVGLWLYLMHVGDDGLRRWERLRDHFTVNTSAERGPDYVTSERPPSPAVPPFPQEREPERERERPGTEAEPLALPAGKLYTAEQIAALTGQAEERGRAEALGMLLGRLLLDENDRGTAMELLFGPRGRRHQRVRPLVEQAAARVAPPPEPARLVGINEGKEGHFEL